MDAVRDFTKAIEVNPSDYRAYSERARCYHLNLRLGRESLADYNKVLSLVPNNAVGYFGRGSLFDEMAVISGKHALENNDQAIFDQEAEEFQKAIDDYSKAIELDPDFNDVYVSRGLAYARKARASGNTDQILKAIADLEKAMSLNWENGYLYKTVDELKNMLEHNVDEQQLTTV
jgi:tetratricopeptide (TPR) repeat protein